VPVEHSNIEDRWIGSLGITASPTRKGLVGFGEPISCSPGGATLGHVLEE
jgi:hypothetical protein